MAKKKISVMGIKILPTPSPKGSIKGIDFLFKVSEGSPADPLFYSSPRLRKLIEKHSDLKGSIVGSISYYHLKWRPNKEWIISEGVYPFGDLSGREFSDFQRKGIASELERKTLGEMKRRFGNPTIRPAFGRANRGRQRQLSARGIRVEADTSYSVKLRDMLSSINALRKKTRKRLRG